MSKILFSPGYGAGWVSWNSSKNNKIAQHIMLSYPPLIEAVEKFRGERRNYRKTEEDKFPENHPAILSMLEEIEKRTGEKPENFYLGGSESLEVYRIDEGSCFRIEEYDGSESVHEFYEDWFCVATLEAMW